MTKLYITVLLFVHDDQHEAFHRYEEEVLSWLPVYGGNLEQRIIVVPKTPDDPLEIHVLSFTDQKSFERFRLDERRVNLKPLADRCFKKIVVYQGKSIS